MDSTSLQILYGTGNPAKLSAMQASLSPLGIELIGLKHMQEKGWELPKISENGKTPLENARIKAHAYYQAFHMPVFSCDSGLYLEGVPEKEQPGIHVRRIDGAYLNDAEMLRYYTGLVKKYGRLTARYDNAICFIWDAQHIYESMSRELGSDPFYIVEKPYEKYNKGFPIDSISVDIKTGKYYYELEEESWLKLAGKDGFYCFFRDILPRVTDPGNSSAP